MTKAPYNELFLSDGANRLKMSAETSVTVSDRPPASSPNFLHNINPATAYFAGIWPNNVAALR